MGVLGQLLYIWLMYALFDLTLEIMLFVLPVNYYFTWVIKLWFQYNFNCLSIFRFKKGTFFPSPSHLSGNSEFRLKLAHLKPNENVNLHCYKKRNHVSLGQFNKTFTTAVKYFNSSSRSNGGTGTVLLFGL